MIIEFILVLALILLLDLVWFAFTIKIYQNQVYNVQKSVLHLNKYYALITYLFLAMGIIFIANIKEYNTKKELIKNCAIFGLLTYGIYNFTSLSIYNDYPVKVALIDTFWGMFIAAVVGYAYYMVASNKDK